MHLWISTALDAMALFESTIDMSRQREAMGCSI
jgi:hypothetical protein